jgi:Ni,Fe-hydrogenase III large subunit
MSAEKLLDHFKHLPLVPGHKPWPRYRLDRAEWRSLVARLAEVDWSLVGIWAEPGEVHVCLRDEADGAIAVASLDCPEGHFPALSTVRPAAIRLERTIQDLFGLVAEGLADQRPWLDHGQWPSTHPLKRAPTAATIRPGTQYAFLPVEGEGLHQIPVGPVHAGIIEPGHFRFHANGETVVRLEQRLGYVHKGIEGLMRSKSVQDAARLASRVSGDSAVAHSLAFALAVEAALDVQAPPRAVWLRALMAELERIANHLGDIGAICNDASFSFMHTHCGVLRERVLRACFDCFGHRLLFDAVVPGGVAHNLVPAGERMLRELVAAMRPRFEALVKIYDNKASLQDRTVTTGVVTAELVKRFAAGGYIGRASGRRQDARTSPGYPPYDKLNIAVPVYGQGDVNARVWVRIDEVRASLGMILGILDGLPEGEITLAALPNQPGEGMALVEAFRGEIMTWVRLDATGHVARCFPRDASWFQWPLLEAAIEGNIVADFPLCNKSFNCSYAGHDL